MRYVNGGDETTGTGQGRPPRRRWVIATSPWRRAPRLALRHPLVLAATAGAVGVLVASVASAPLFLASAGAEALTIQVESRCPTDTGIDMATAFGVPGGGPQSAELPVFTPDGQPPPNPAAPVADRFGPAAYELQTEARVGHRDSQSSSMVSILSREDALDHVETIEGTPGPGVWISDRLATVANLRLGDETELGLTLVDEPSGVFTSPSAGTVSLPVAGIYRDMAGSITTDYDYWCSNADLLLPSDTGAELPHPVVLMDAETHLDALEEVGGQLVVGSWQAPLRTEGLALPEAEELISTLGCGTGQASELTWCQDATGPDATTGALDRGDEAEVVTDRLGSHLPFVVDRARGIEDAVGGGVRPVAGFAAVAAVGLVAAATALWFDRRRKELHLLAVRGVSPAALGVKAVLELVVALIAGGIAGLLAAYLLVAWLGPSATLGSEAIRQAVVATLAATGTCAFVVWAVAAARARTTLTSRHRRFRLAWLPWELGLGALTVVAHRRLEAWGVPISQGSEVSRVDVLGLMFPLLFLLTSVAVAARLASFGLGPLRWVTSRGRPPLFLAVRRVGRRRATAVGLVTAAAIAAGVLGYAATLTQSVQATLDAKAQVFVGSDVALHVTDDHQLPAELVPRSTEVDVYRVVRLSDGTESASGGGGDGGAILALDRNTFEQAAFWDSTFADRPLPDLLGRLAQAEDGQLPGIVLGFDGGEPVQVTIRGYDTHQFTVTPVHGVDAFPGMRRVPTVIVDKAALADLGVRVDHRLGISLTDTETWVRGDPAETHAHLDAADIRYSEPRSVDGVVDKASFLTVSWTFGYMRSLGIIAALLTVAGVAIYLDARRRSQVLGYAFVRRMGLTRRQHLRALATELFLTVTVGSWLGLAIALAGARLAYANIDPVPGFQPAPLLRPAVPMTVATALVALVAAGTGAALAQRRADRDDPLEALRAGA